MMTIMSPIMNIKEGALGGGVIDHLMSLKIFTLMMNKIFRKDTNQSWSNVVYFYTIWIFVMRSSLYTNRIWVIVNSFVFATIWVYIPCKNLQV